MRDPSALQVESFLEMMSAERGAATNTLQSYERDLEDARSFLNERSVRLVEAAPDDLRAYLAHLARQGFAASSQARRLSALRQFFKFLYGEGLRGDDPTGILDAPRKGRSLPKTLSVEDVGRLIARAEVEAAEPGNTLLLRRRMHLLVELLYATGLRVSELVSLPASVLAQTGRFLIVKGKGNKERLVPLSRAAVAALETYREEGLLTRGAELAKKWEDALHSLKGLPHVIDIRNIGLAAAIDLDPIEGQPGKRGFDLLRKFFFEKDLMVRVSGDTLAFSPPLIVEKSHIDDMFGRVGETLKEL